MSRKKSGPKPEQNEAGEVISHCSKGWRVFSNIKERRSGRHTYPTPGIAAGKYWKKEPIKFVWLTDGKT